MLENILSERGAIPKRSKSLHNLGVQIVNASIKGRLLTSLLNPMGHKLLGLLVHLLDASGVNSPVSNQVLKSNASGLPANGVEARENNGLGSVIDDKGDTRNLLEGSNITTLAANDATLEIVGRNMNRGHGNLASLIGSTTLDGDGENLTGGFLRFSFYPKLRVAKYLSLLLDGVLANTVKKLAMSVVLCKGGDSLKLGGLLRHELLKVAAATIQLALQTRKLVLALIEGIITPVKRLLALHNTRLKGAKFALTLLFFVLGSLLKVENLLLSLKNGLLLGGFSLPGSLGVNALCVLLSLGDLRVCLLDTCGVLVLCNCKCNRGTHREAYDSNDYKWHFVKLPRCAFL